MFGGLFGRRSKEAQETVHSNYWLGQDWDMDVIKSSSPAHQKARDMHKVAAAKRAIGNFVSIVTGEKIPVKFATDGDSKTDGKEVIIGADITEPKDFDVNVGVALHEGSHIKLTDFSVLGKIEYSSPLELKKMAKERNIKFDDFKQGLKDTLNYIEDRRIDKHIYDSAPGYQPYYHAMYEKYWNNDDVDSALKSSDFRDETTESYDIRINNLHNENSDLDALKGLRKISEMIDLENIDRLKNTNDVYELAKDVYKEMLTNIPVPPQQSGEGEGEGDNEQEKKESDQQGEGQGEGGQGEGEGDPNPDGEPNENGEPQDGEGNPNPDQDGEPQDGESNPDQDGEPQETKAKPQTTDKPIKGDMDRMAPKEEPKELSNEQKQRAKEGLKKQKDFLDGKIQKESLSAEDGKQLEVMEESGTELSQAAASERKEDFGSVHGVECVVIKKMTRKVMESDMFPLAGGRGYRSDGLTEFVPDEVKAGIRLGTYLGKKLQVRGEQRSTKFNRQKKRQD
jgi:hypothetical protein